MTWVGQNQQCNPDRACQAQTWSCVGFSCQKYFLELLNSSSATRMGLGQQSCLRSASHACTGTYMDHVPVSLLSLLSLLYMWVQQDTPKSARTGAYGVILGYCGQMLIPGGQLSKWITTASLRNIFFTEEYTIGPPECCWRSDFGLEPSVWACVLTFASLSSNHSVTSSLQYPWAVEEGRVSGVFYCLHSAPGTKGGYLTPFSDFMPHVRHPLEGHAFLLWELLRLWLHNAKVPLINVLSCLCSRIDFMFSWTDDVMFCWIGFMACWIRDGYPWVSGTTLFLCPYGSYLSSLLVVICGRQGYIQHRKRSQSIKVLLWPKNFQEKMWEIFYHIYLYSIKLPLFYKILKGKFKVTRKQIIIHIFLHTLSMTHIWGHHQQSTITAFERVNGSQYSWEGRMDDAESWVVMQPRLNKCF